MKRMKTLLALSVLIGGLAIGVMGCSARSVPLSLMISQQEIPSGIPADVRTEIERLYDDRAEVQLDAAQRLGRMGERAAPAREFLLLTMVSATPIVRGGRSTFSSDIAREALIALLNTGGEEVLTLTLTTIKDPQNRISVILTLAMLANANDPNAPALWAVKPIIAAFGDPDKRVRGVAVGILNIITNRDFGQDQKKYQAWWEQREGAIQKPTERR